MSKIILMIHGMMAGPWCWDNYKNYFERKGYSCISPALRFHDLNPNTIPDPQLGTTSLLEYAADLEEQLRLSSLLPRVKLQPTWHEPPSGMESRDGWLLPFTTRLILPARDWRTGTNRWVILQARAFLPSGRSRTRVRRMATAPDFR